MAEDCNSWSHEAFILRFALVEIVAGHLGASGVAHCWTQEWWEAARGSRSDRGCVAGRGWLAVCWFLGVMGCLGQVPVQLRNCLTFDRPSPMNLYIPYSADRKRSQACLPPMLRDRGGTATLSPANASPHHQCRYRRKRCNFLGAVSHVAII